MPSPALPLLELLTRLVRGEISVESTAEQLVQAVDSSPDTSHSVAKIDGATIDLGRQQRCGFGEVIYGEGKSAELVTAIVQRQLEAGQRVLVTRIDGTAAAQIHRQIPSARFNPIARTLAVFPQSHSEAPRPLADEMLQSQSHAAVVTAGSTDVSVAEEAIETLHWMNVPYQRFEDIGVAGPQRLLMAIPKLRLASVVVVIAGMEGALPAAVAGHLAVPIIAVPTSVGYGANLGGMTTLLGMLCACAPSVSVVNIDAGFKAGYIAGMIVRQLQTCRSSS